MEKFTKDFDERKVMQSEDDARYSRMKSRMGKKLRFPPQNQTSDNHGARLTTSTRMPPKIPEPEMLSDEEEFKGSIVDRPIEPPVEPSLEPVDRPRTRIVSFAPPSVSPPVELDEMNVPLTHSSHRPASTARPASNSLLDSASAFKVDTDSDSDAESASETSNSDEWKCDDDPDHKISMIEAEINQHNSKIRLNSERIKSIEKERDKVAENFNEMHRKMSMLSSSKKMIKQKIDEIDSKMNCLKEQERELLQSIRKRSRQRKEHGSKVKETMVKKSMLEEQHARIQRQKRRISEEIDDEVNNLRKLHRSASYGQ